jgi:hypothetical protein
MTPRPWDQNRCLAFEALGGSGTTWLLRWAGTVMQAIALELRFFSLSSAIPRIGSLAAAHRDRKRERRAHVHLALNPDSPAVELDELPAEGQP